MNGAKIAGGGAAGGGLGTAIVYIAGRFGAHLNSEDGALIAFGAIVVFAFLVHNGVAGVWRLILHGSPTPKPESEAGLTLVELLIALVIIAVVLLIAFGVPSR